MKNRENSLLLLARKKAFKSTSSSSNLYAHTHLCLGAGRLMVAEAGEGCARESLLCVAPEGANDIELKRSVATMNYSYTAVIR